MQNLSETGWAKLRQRSQCWHCKHNEVSAYCGGCLNSTVLFEKTDGVLGDFKPNYEEGPNWNKYPGKD